MTLLGVIVFSIIAIIIASVFLLSFNSDVVGQIVIISLIIIAFNITMFKIKKLEETIENLKNQNDKN